MDVEERVVLAKGAKWSTTSLVSSFLVALAPRFPAEARAVVGTGAPVGMQPGGWCNGIVQFVRYATVNHQSTISQPTVNHAVHALDFVDAASTKRISNHKPGQLKK